MYNLNEMQLAVIRLHALAHKLRIKILQQIAKKPDSQVKELYTALKIEQSVCSQHLKILRDADFVFSERVGKTVRYSLNYDLLRLVTKNVDDFLAKK